MIAQDSGNRYTESDLAMSLARLEAKHGDPLAALPKELNVLRQVITVSPAGGSGR